MAAPAPNRVGQAPEPLVLVQRFVNTADLEGGTDDLDDVESARRWLVRNGLVARGEPLGEPERAALVEVREALRRLARHDADRRGQAAALAALNAFALRAPLHVRLGGRESADLAPSSPGVDGAIGRLLAIVFGAVREGTWSRLKTCRNEACQWVFYDASRNRSGAWCTMAVCGNRQKLRSFRARRAAR